MVTRCPPCTLGQYNQVGENDALSLMAITPRGRVNDGRMRLKQITQVEFEVL